MSTRFRTLFTAIPVNSILYVNENELDNFRTKRKITLESQRLSYVSNMQEELQEFLEAENVLEEVDALCDMMVFTLNTIPKGMRCDIRDIHDEMNKYLVQGEKIDKTIGNFIAMITEDIVNDDEPDKPMKLLALILFLIFCLLDRNYDPVVCLRETVKEIDSRQQDPEQAKVWDKLEGEKWLKDKNQDPSTLYKADYSLGELLF